jgi:hypothetical protein
MYISKLIAKVTWPSIGIIIGTKIAFHDSKTIKRLRIKANKIIVMITDAELSSSANSANNMQTN